jgi:membrane-associated phospholipid phosphatase
MYAARSHTLPAAFIPADPLLWMGLTLVGLFDARVWGPLQISISGGGLQIIAACLLLFIGCCIRALFTDAANLGTLFETLAALAVVPAVFAPLSYIATRSAHAPIDAYLRAADAMLGVDAVSFRAFILSNPTLAWLSTLAYISLLPQCLAAIFVMPVIECGRRGFRMFRAASLALAICCVAAHLFPAIGTVPKLEPWYGDWLALRNLHAPFITDAGHVDGIISFPSFHAAMAAILAYSCRGLGVVSWVIGALDVAMCVSAVPLGFHYATDIVAGVLLAATCLFMTRERTRQARMAPRVLLPEAVGVGEGENGDLEYFA